MDIRAITRQRLHTQRLLGAPFATPEEVVGWLGAVQSQEFAVARWSVGQRAGAAGEDIVERAIADGTILRTHLLRPTWHFVLATDIRWMLALTAPRVHAVNAHSYHKLELDEATFARSHAAMTRALADGNHLTRQEIGAVLNDAGIITDALRLGYLLMRAELDAVICGGAPRGAHHTYALLDERAPQARSLAPDEALAELTLRYFTSHGPATPKDFQWWSNLTMTDIRRGLELVKDHLERVVVAGRTYWHAPSPPAPETASPVARLLQGYDEYIIAYSESRDALDAAGLTTGLADRRSFFVHALTLDGQIVGFWRRLVKVKEVVIEIQPLRPLAEAEVTAVEVAAASYGRFVGKSASARFQGGG